MAQAADDKATSGASGSAGAPASGAEKMFAGLDKNKDGYLSREEVAGSPHAKDFDKLDKNGDGKLSPEEHAAAPEHAGDRASTGGAFYLVQARRGARRTIGALFERLFSPRAAA